MKTLSIVFALSLLSGCALFSSSQERAAGKVADGVMEYCKQTDAAFRAKFRADVNAQAGGNTIAVECAE